MENRKKGSLAEDKAILFLKNKGYNIIYKNFYTIYGEIDIIGERDNLITFFEVKYRKTLKNGYPREAVSKKKQEKLITNEPNIVLTTFYADCVPIFLLDPIKKAIGIAHSGWKGTVLEIGKKTILKMQEEYETEAKDLLVGIGPSISLCCFQVDKPVAEKFRNELPFSEKYIFEDNIKGKFKIDLQNIIKESILSLGVLEENIEISKICTLCNSNMFFSHRAMGEERGSLAGLMCLKE